MNDDDSGYRSVPHTADFRVESWAPTREECIAQAVLGAVASFADTSAVHAEGTRVCQLVAHSDEDLLAAVLDEVIYLLDTTGQVPVDVEVEPLDGEVDVRFEMVDATALPQLGAIPKGVSLNGIRLACGPSGWRSAVTLDV